MAIVSTQNNILNETLSASFNEVLLENGQLWEGMMDWISTNSEAIDKLQNWADWASIGLSFVPVANYVAAGIDAASAAMDVAQGQGKDAALRGAMAGVNLAAPGARGIIGLGAKGAGLTTKAVGKAAEVATKATRIKPVVGEIASVSKVHPTLGTTIREPIFGAINSITGKPMAREVAQRAIADKTPNVLIRTGEKMSAFGGRQMAMARAGARAGLKPTLKTGAKGTLNLGKTGLITGGVYGLSNLLGGGGGGPGMAIGGGGSSKLVSHGLNISQFDPYVPLYRRPENIAY